MVQQVSIVQAYEHCKNVTFNHAKTFYFASLFLEKEKRKACYAVYAFCRYVDDLVDNAPKESLMHDTIQLVEQWRSAIRNVYEGKYTIYC